MNRSRHAHTALGMNRPMQAHTALGMNRPMQAHTALGMNRSMQAYTALRMNRSMQAHSAVRGARPVTGEQGGTLSLWRTAVEEEMREACRTRNGLGRPAPHRNAGRGFVVAWSPSRSKELEMNESSEMRKEKDRITLSSRSFVGRASEL